jgi:hypothetical protein
MLEKSLLAWDHRLWRKGASGFGLVGDVTMKDMMMVRRHFVVLGMFWDAVVNIVRGAGESIAIRAPLEAPCCPGGQCGFSLF